MAYVDLILKMAADHVANWRKYTRRNSLQLYWRRIRQTMKYLCRWILARVLVDVKVVGFVGAHWISGNIWFCAVDGRGHADDGHAQIDGHQDVDKGQKAARHRDVEATAGQKSRYEYQLTWQIFELCSGDRRHVCYLRAACSTFSFMALLDSYWNNLKWEFPVSVPIPIVR